MASKVVRDAFEAHLVAALPAGMTYVDTNNMPPDRAALPDRWCTIDFIERGEEQMSLGTPGQNLYRESGTARVRLVTRPGDSETPLLDHAQVILDQFRNQRFSGVVTNAVNPPASTPDDSDGAWREAAVAIDYTFDRFA